MSLESTLLASSDTTFSNIGVRDATANIADDDRGNSETVTTCTREYGKALEHFSEEYQQFEALQAEIESDISAFQQLGSKYVFWYKLDDKPLKIPTLSQVLSFRCMR